MVSKRKEQGWRELFENCVDTTCDVNIITTEQIRDFLGEVRLATKMDSRSDLPTVFRENNYFLLPLENGGDYAIVRGDGFHDLEDLPDTKKFTSQLQTELTTLSSGRRGEQKYLDFVYYTGLLEEFLSINGLYLTLRGRERTKPFSFRVGNVELSVGSVQIEIDAGYESSAEQSIVIIEAKVGRKWSNFNIRQLYYPLRTYMKKISSRSISTVFFAYNPENQTYNFWKYSFSDPEDFLSLTLEKNASYSVQRSRQTISAQDISKDERGRNEVSGKWMIPQADDFQKVLELPFRVAEGCNNSQKISEFFGFDLRQSSYYRHAAEALGLVESRQGTYTLTPLGVQYVGLTAQNRHALVSSLLFKLPIIEKVIQELIQKEHLTKKDIASIIERTTKYNQTTANRRASTICSWLEWLQDSMGIVRVDGRDVYLNS